jgi:hypothetical protein
VEGVGSFSLVVSRRVEMDQSGRSRITVVIWGVILLLVVGLVIGLLSGGWVISTKAGCRDRASTDPDYANANWYGLGIGVCVAE